jgi:HAE1 family hydrophobic/amphiphilic exporter-1
LSILSGIIASTCLAVLLVPSFFAVLQGFDEWRKAKKNKRQQLATVPAK